MIEFDGYLTGDAEKHFWKQSSGLFLKFFLFGLLVCIPPCITGIRSNFWFPFYLLFICFVMILIVLYLPKTKKSRSMTPKKIYFEDGYIICIADQYTESRSISDVKKVRDFGKFYELVFPFGKSSEKFICQKVLLVKGSLEEFEALFPNKLERIQ